MWIAESYPSVTIKAEYRIGGRYRYVNSNNVFTLLKINNCNNFVFECGHWCTLNVFIDLIDCNTNRKVNSVTEKKMYF